MDPTVVSHFHVHRAIVVLATSLVAAASGAENAFVDGMVIDAPPLVNERSESSPAVASPSAGDRGGIGQRWPASGRFGGRGHSDGVLDWELPKFGMIEKGPLAAHPLNASHRPLRGAGPGMVRVHYRIRRCRPRRETRAILRGRRSLQANP